MGLFILATKRTFNGYKVTNQNRFQLQRTRSVDVGCDHGHADILRLGLRVREERGGHQVHLHATGDAFIISSSYLNTIRTF